MVKRYLDKILILLGGIIILIAVLMKISTKYEQKKLVDDYKEYVSNMQNEDLIFNERKQEEGSKVGTNQKQANDDIIGILYIPKIDLSVAIKEGVDNETLKYSVGHFNETAMPGQVGNFCVIGHRSYAYGEFFNRLDEIKKNDCITIESKGNAFKYKVTDIFVVTPDEVSVLNPTEDPEITLITCTPIRVGSHRLIIKGALMEN